jgi:aminopeptidase-like protein
LKKYLRAGFVITCIGDKGDFTYKKSRIGNALPDRAVELLLKQTEDNYRIVDFFPSGGSDERQYCSQGFNLPVGSLMRTMYGKYSEYHTSGDNKDFISFEAMERSVNKYVELVEMMEQNDFYINTMPFCEPQLGKRGLYPTLGSQKEMQDSVEAMMWILNLADGETDLIDISNRSKVAFKKFLPIVGTLVENGILVRKHRSE